MWSIFVSIKQHGKYIKIKIITMGALTRSSVAKRESFLKSICKPSTRLSEVGAVAIKRNQRALDLLLEIQTRYEHDDASWELATANEPKGKVEMTWEMITQNGKYSLD